MQNLRHYSYTKDYNPDKPGPMPDPERWLPLRERDTYRGKRKKAGPYTKYLLCVQLNFQLRRCLPIKPR